MFYSKTRTRPGCSDLFWLSHKPFPLSGCLYYQHHRVCQIFDKWFNYSTMFLSQRSHLIFKYASSNPDVFCSNFGTTMSCSASLALSQFFFLFLWCHHHQHHRVCQIFDKWCYYRLMFLSQRPHSRLKSVDGNLDVFCSKLRQISRCSVSLWLFLKILFLSYGCLSTTIKFHYMALLYSVFARI